MTSLPDWPALTDAIEFAVWRIENDPDPLNERERADGHQYVMRIIDAVSQASLLSFDVDRPAFLTMQDAVRYLGAAGPDIDYDVAMVRPGVRHRITGERGAASYVGIAVYAHAAERGASEIVASVDVDELVDPEGRFTYEFEHSSAVRVIVRQYFHDRATQPRGSWSIEPITETTLPTGTRLPTMGELQGRVGNAAQVIRWNTQLNELWPPGSREVTNRFIRQTADDIVAAIPNPDVVYAFTWWRLAEGESLEISFTPPDTRYWALQLCDRWFQCQPGRPTNLHDRQITPEADGTVRIVVADGDPGAPNWLDTSGHRVGTLFFRWLHADPEKLPGCRVVRR